MKAVIGGAGSNKVSQVQIVPRMSRCPGKQASWRICQTGFFGRTIRQGGIHNSETNLSAAEQSINENEVELVAEGSL